MRWLLTAAADSDLDELATQLARVGASLGDAAPVPLGTAEIVVAAEGPADLPRRLAQACLNVKANPDSDIDLY